MIDSWDERLLLFSNIILSIATYMYYFDKNKENWKSV